MKTNQINRLLVVAAVAFLPIACGTSSPTGPDVAAIGANATVSAFRAELPVPPQAPEAPSPVPVPDPSPKPEPPTPLPDSSTVIPPTNRGGNRPAPQPDDSGVDTSPNAPTSEVGGSVPAPAPTSEVTGTIPAPPAPTSEVTGTIPAPPATDRNNTGGIAAPVPPTAPPVPSEYPGPASTVTCRASTIEITPLILFRGTDGSALEAILRGTDGVEITDVSCEKVLWTSDSASSVLVITYGQDSRHVTITGPAGEYNVTATAPNGQRGSLIVVLQ